MNEHLAKKIVKTAKITAHLYKMQLEELGNY
jgi:3-oxoacyl-[acyl-carrier-protein] synthase-3